MLVWARLPASPRFAMLELGKTATPFPLSAAAGWANAEPAPTAIKRTTIANDARHFPLVMYPPLRLTTVLHAMPAAPADRFHRRPWVKRSAFEKHTTVVAASLLLRATVVPQPFALCGLRLTL